VALTAALASGPSHAYLFRGPHGAGKRAAARAFAAEILAVGAEDPDDARRRALLDPSPHPDLVWLAPRGAQHLVEEVRERVIRAAAYRPFEGGKRVFVVEAAEAMRDESQNALLKTLEEPPAFVHLILLSSEPEALLETIASRCQPIDFAPLLPEVLEAELAADGLAVEEIAAAARLAAGDLDRARLLVGERGRELRAEAERCVAAALSGEIASAPWRRLLDRAQAAGDDAEAAAREALEEEASAGLKRTARDIADGAKRAGRRKGRRLQPRPPRPSQRSGRPARPRQRPARRRGGPGDPPRPRPQRLRGVGPGGALLSSRADDGLRRRLSLVVEPRPPPPAGAPSPAPAPGRGGLSGPPGGT
jgi:DNA polymerase-3 subunit delta'